MTAAHIESMGELLPTIDILRRYAEAIHGTITPCADRTWDDCITHDNGQILFWFNDASGSTHVITA